MMRLVRWQPADPPLAGLASVFDPGHPPRVPDPLDGQILIEHRCGRYGVDVAHDRRVGRGWEQVSRLALLDRIDGDVGESPDPLVARLVGIRALGFWLA